MKVLDRTALSRATLARQMLLERADCGLQEAVERLAGLQAQVPKPPFIALWSRLQKFSRADVRRSLAKKDLVRATMMRGTIHLMTARDFLKWRGAIQPVLERGFAAIARPSSPLDIEALVAEGRAFFDEEPRPFEALRDHFARLFPKEKERLMAYAVRMHLPLVLLPDDSPWSWPANASFAVAESWLRKPLGPDASMRDLVRRYLAAFGPATPGDFQTWSGLQSARKTFDELRDELEVLRDEKKRELFDLPSAPRPDPGTPAPVRFLPEFDNVLLSHTDRTRIMSEDDRKRISLGNLRMLPSFLVDGFVAGSWSVARTKKSATLTLDPFHKVTRAVRGELAEEGERLLRFLEEEAVEHRVEFVRS